VGLTETEMIDPPLAQERKRTVPFKQLLENIAYGDSDEDTVSSLASRLSRLQQRLTADDERLIAEQTDGGTLPELIHGLLDSLVDLPDQPTRVEALAPLAANPKLRQTLIEIHQRSEIIVDTVSIDRVKEAGFDQEASERLRLMVGDFQQFIAENKDELTALQILYNQPYGAQGVTRAQLQELAQAMQNRPPHFWTEEKLWRAYAQLEKDRVRGANTQRVLTDLISLVRHALQPEEELAPYPELVQQRYEAWLEAQEAAGKQFTEKQRWWLDRIAGYIGLNLHIRPDDFEIDGEFYNRGGRFGARDALGEEWLQLLVEMNAALIM
jgi:type I restriction enzyme R subunit